MDSKYKQLIDEASPALTFGQLDQIRRFLMDALDEVDYREDIVSANINDYRNFCKENGEEVKADPKAFADSVRFWFAEADRLVREGKL